MIEHLKQETFDLLMEIFFEDEATDSPKVNEVNQHISRKHLKDTVSQFIQKQEKQTKGQDRWL